MRKYFVGYATRTALEGVTDTQAKKLTHLNIAFAPMVGDVTVMVLNEYEKKELKRLKKANPNLNILVSTGGGDNRGHGEATRTEAGLEKLVKSTIDIVKEYDLDGIDCDWEFPGDDGHLEEKYQQTNLFKRYREELDRMGEKNGHKYWLTTAGAAGQWYLDRTEIATNHKYLDFINIMTYDANMFETITAHHTHLYEPKNNPLSTQSADYSISLMNNAGVPLEKILIGVAFYSRRWYDVPKEGTGLFKETKLVNCFGPTYTEISLKYEKEMGYIKYFDENAKAPYLYNGECLITYDDPLSVKYKCEYAKEKGLGGAFYWEHGSDMTGELFNSIYDNLYL